VVADWLRLPTTLGLRPWVRYGDVAHVAMWAQAYDSTRMSFGGVEVCAYPTLKATLMQALELVVAPTTAVTMGNALAWDLARVWTRLLDDTLRAFPSPAQRLTSRVPGYWVTETGREVALVGLLQGKVQWWLLVGPWVLQVRDASAGMHEARTPGSAERLELFEAVHASECSKPYHAIPWLDDGDLHWGNTELLVTTSLRFGLDMPAQAVPWWHCPCGWHGGATVAHAHTAEERHATNVAHREWALHD
jgi:hypothetical protein